MKKIITIFIALTLASCHCNKNISNYERDNFDYYKSSNGWITAYKDAVFYECLKEGYKNDTIFKLMLKKDLFNPYDGIDFKDIDSANALGRKVIQKMPKALFCDDCEVTGRNYISANCLHYYASSELDSIAKEAYKAYKGNE